MQCNLICPNCKKIHEINDRYCEHCGIDLEPYIIHYKNKHLPIHFDGGNIDAVIGNEEEEEVDLCYCCFDCFCKSKKRRRNSLLNILDSLCGCL